MALGDRGDEVRAEQERLNALRANLTVDGIWGPKTQAAFEQYDSQEVEGAADTPTAAAPAAGGDTTGNYTGDEDIRFVGLAGRPEVWKNTTDGSAWVVYFTPGVEPPIPMMWKVRGEEDLKSFFGDSAIAYDRSGSMEEFEAAGALLFGDVDEFVLKGENPFSGWVSQFERERETLPFLNDPEVAAMFASAWLEGRNPSDAELAGLEWFSSKTQGEQRWWQLKASQPKTADQIETSNRIVVRELMRDAGIDNPPQEVVDYLADQWTQGLWTEQMRNEQVALLADPTKEGNRDTGLLGIIGDTTMDTTQDKALYVDQELRRWLGPQYSNWTQEQKDVWVGKLRNDPDAKDAFQQELSRQRMAMFSEYENPDLTYEDIAQPWRSYASSSWGTPVVEDDEFLQKVISMNDPEQASKMLRGEGFERGYDKVVNEVVRGVRSGMSNNVRGAV